MAWVRIDDHFDEHPKLAKVGPLGWGVWAASLAYCNRNLTDGILPRSVAKTLAHFEVVDEAGVIWTLARTSGYDGRDIDTDWVIELLLTVGLWEWDPEGYIVHDYLDFQPSARDVLARKQKLSDTRREAGHRGGVATQERRRSIKANRATAQAKEEAKLKPQPQPQESSKELSLASDKRPRERDELFEALCQVTGNDWHQLTPTGRGSVNKALKDLRSVGATPSEIRTRAAYWPKLFPDAKLTPPALAKHWAALGSSVPLRLKACPYCGSYEHNEHACPVVEEVT